MSEMHDVVKMLLERMKDCPEEFVRDPRNHMNDYRPATKWERALGIVYEVATQYEKDALDLRQQEAKRMIYMGSALQAIVSDEEPEEDKPYLTMKTQGRYATALAQSMASTSSALATSIDASLLKSLEAKHKAAEIEMQRQTRDEYMNAISGSALG